MQNGKFLDLYSDYLISAFGQTTTTGLFSLLGGGISHDQIQRLLAWPAVHLVGNDGDIVPYCKHVFKSILFKSILT